MPTISTLTVDVNANTTRFRTGIRAVGVGLAALAGGAAFAFKQFEDAQKVSNQTAAVLESTGSAANVTAKQVDKLANSLSRKAGIDDEAIQSGENLLLTFTNIRNETGKGNDIFNRATKTVLDMSVALGTDMKSAAIQVGKALQDPTIGLTALRRVGVNFNETQTETIQKLFESGNALKAQKLILRELNTEFAGSAEAQKTASATLGVAFGNLAERIGGLLAPALTFLINEVTGLVKTFQKDVRPAFEAAIEWLGQVWEAVQPVAVAFGRELMEALTQTWQVIRTKVWPALQDLFEALQPVFRVVGTVIAVVLKLALEALPVVVEAIGVVIAILAKVVDAFVAVVNFVREKFVEPIVGAIQKVIEWLQRAAEWVAEKFGAAWEAIKGPVLAVIGAIIAAVKTLVGWVITAVEKLADLFALEASPPFATKGGTVGAPAIPRAQMGGVVARSGLAVIHRGENIIPRGEGISSGDIVLQVDGRELARITRNELNRLAGRNASSGLR